MPYTVQTEAARVAIAHRERDAEIERINGLIDARLRELAVAQGYVAGPNALVKLASDDVVIRRLILEQIVREHVCERLIGGGYVPIIELGEPGKRRDGARQRAFRTTDRSWRIGHGSNPLVQSKDFRSGACARASAMPGLNLQDHHTPRHATLSGALRSLARRVSCVDLAFCITVARSLCP